MQFLSAPLPGVIVIEPDVFRDPRGFFFETYHTTKYRDGGIPTTFVQDNHSRSTQGTLRGMHAQRLHPQGKLVRVILGAVFDVAVDIRRGSPTFLKWFGVTLSADNFRQCYVPPGFAHGFVVTSEVAEFEYKCTDFYDPTDELRILWNDPAIGIDWPIQNPVLSDKDHTARPIAELMEQLPLYEEGRR